MSQIQKTFFAIGLMLISQSHYAAQIKITCHPTVAQCNLAEKNGYFNLWSESKLPELKNFLKTHGEGMINVRHPEGKGTLLMRAAHSRAWTTEGFKALLELPGLDINAQSYTVDGWDSKDCHKFTALMLAVGSLQVDKVKLLLQHKANVNLTHSFHETALHMLVQMKRRSRLCAEASAQNIKENCAIIDILLGAGADINAKGFNQKTPLMYAIQDTDDFNDLHGEVVDYLLQRGADMHREAKENEYSSTTTNAFKLAADKPHILAVLQKHLEKSSDSRNQARHLGIVGYSLLHKTKAIIALFEKTAITDEIGIRAIKNQFQDLLSSTQAQLDQVIQENNSEKKDEDKSESNDFIIITQE